MQVCLQFTYVSIPFQKKLAGHPHVINFISACCNDRGGGAKEYLVVTELCSGTQQLLKLVQVYRPQHHSCTNRRCFV